MVTKNNVLKIVILILLITTVLSALITPVSADSFTEANNVIIVPGSEFNLTITTGKGVVFYNWNITQYNNDSSEFNIISSKEKTPFIEADNKPGKVGNFSKGAGKYTFTWKNNNENKTKNIKLFYKIEYPLPPEEEDGIGSGCYSSILVVSLVMLFAGFGYLRKKL